MRDISITLLLIAACFQVITAAYGQQIKPVGQATMTFLKIDPVARSVGMGGASTCMDNDINAIFHNPAGIAKLSGGSISLNYNQWLADTRQYGIAAGYGHSGIGTFAAGLVLMDNGDIVRTVPDASERGFHIDEPFNVNQVSAGLCYGREITNKFSIGGQIRYVYQDLGPADIVEITAGSRDTLLNAENKEGTFALDFGTMYYTGFKDLRVAMSLRNFGTSVRYAYDYYQLPLVLKVGIAMDILSIITDVDDHNLQMQLETILPNDYTERINCGWEYGFKDLFFLRAGFRFNYDEGGFAAGFGLTPTITDLNVKIDYAFVDHGNIFGAVHRMSFGFGL